MSKKHSHIIPVIILLIASFFRFNGLGYGLPYVLHPDEHQYVNAAITCLSDPQACTSQLERYNNPPLFKMILTALFVLISYLAIPTTQLPEAVDSLIWRNYYWYLGRFASAAAGILTVAAVYALTMRLYAQKRVAYLAALSVAVCFIHVRESHAAVNDAMLSLTIVLALYSAAGLLRDKGFSQYVRTGVAIGIATATKYLGIFAAAFLILAHLFNTSAPLLTWRQKLFSIRLYVGLIAIPVTFIILTPLVVGSWDEMLRRVSGLAEYGRSGYHHYILDAHGGWLFYLKVLGWGMGWLLLPLSLLVLCFSLVRRRPQDLLLGMPSVIYYAIMASQKMFFARFILPIVPFLLIITSAWLVRWVDGLNSSRFSKYSRVSLGTIAAILLFQPCITSLWFDILLMRPDTRLLAVEWLTEFVPQGSAIFFEECALPEQMVTGKPEWPYVRAAEQKIDHPDRLEYYLERRVKYIIIGDFCTEVKLSDPEKEAGRRTWLDRMSQLRLVKEITPYWLPGKWFAFESRLAPAQDTLARLYAGPTIRIYEVPLPREWYALNPLDRANQIVDVASLYGWEMADRSLSPGSTLTIGLYWQNHRWKPRYQMSVALVDTNGASVSEAVAIVAPGFERDLEVKRSRPVKSIAQLHIPPEVMPGSYSVQVSISDPTVPYVVGKIRLEGASVSVTQ